MSDDVKKLMLSVDASVELARRNLRSLTGEIEKFQRNADQNLDKVETRFDKTGFSVGKLKTMFAGLGAGIGFSAISAGFKSILDAADDVATAADQANVSVERFQTLRGAFRALEVDAEQFDKILKRLITTQGDVASGAETTATKALDKLGVSAKVLSGEIETTDQLLDALATALGKVESPAERAALAADIVGQKLGAQLAAAIGDGGVALKQAEQNFRDTGKVIDSEMVAKLADANEKWDLFVESVQAKSVMLAANTISTFEAIGNAAGMIWDKYKEASANLVLDFDWLYDEKTLQGAQDELIRQHRKTLDRVTAEQDRQANKLASVRLPALDWLNPEPNRPSGGGGAGNARSSRAGGSKSDGKRVFSPHEQRMGYDLPIADAMPASLIGEVETETAAALARMDAALKDLGATGLEVEQTFSEVFDADLQRRLQDIQEYGVRDLSRGLADVIVYGEDVGDVLENSFKRAAAAMLEAVIQAQVLGPLLDGIKKGGGEGGGLLGSIVSGIGAAFGGGRATGGPVQRGMVYEVGEQGRELFVPRVNGDIISNANMRRMMGGGGGGTTVEQHFHVNAQGAVLASGLIAEMQAIGVQAAGAGAQLGVAGVRSGIRRNRRFFG
jgi:hypothetical protein